MVVTPVSTAMTTAKWLRTIICPLPSKPSADLQGANLMDNIWAEQRRLEALKLNYKVLETMCTAEAQVLHAKNLTSLFHRCMLACSAELVLATHKTVTMLFLAVLERIGITAFNLSKVIQSFIRHEESLPRELRRHLNSLEERLLESMVWEKGSSMYNSLTVARPALSAEINLGFTDILFQDSQDSWEEFTSILYPIEAPHAPSTSTVPPTDSPTRIFLLIPMPSLDAIAMHINFSSGGLSPVHSLHKHETSPVERNNFTSLVKDCLLGLNNLKSKPLPPPLYPTRSNPGGGGEPCAETGINICFCKINKLAAVRINAMVERLQLSQQIRESVYCLCPKRTLNQRTSLFFNCHIDQIILCCFYGVAKISQLNLTFKEIIYNYGKQPQCKPQVFRSVFQDHVDIITFYNKIFAPTVKPLLVELGPVGTAMKTNRDSEVNHNNDASVFPALPDMSPKKVSATHSVYVSPLRTSEMDALISHSSKSYYACVGESTHAYSPFKDLTDINHRLNSNRRVRGALNFDDVDVDVGLVSDSMVVNSLYLQNGSAAASTCAVLKPEQLDP
ncbi:retinoblastoma-related protein 1 [Citrus sinensis]|nr:retinoblastoma-related protein 1 [Citrus sinensis]